MAIDSKIPEISALKKRVKARFEEPLNVHADFLVLREAIYEATRVMISESTLERLWNYSTRESDNVSRHTLDILSRYAGCADWEAFLQLLKDESANESDVFNAESIAGADLDPGAEVKVGWLPNRLCIFRYLGSDRYVVASSENSKLCIGDTFSCLRFQLYSPAFLEDLAGADGCPKADRYGIGLRNGLTTLRLIKE